MAAASAGRGWAAWRSRWRFSGVVLGFLATVSCGETKRTTTETSYVGDEPLSPAVVEWVARRDGLSPADARARVVDTLRLVAAARDQAAQHPDAEALEPQRRSHLVSSARARLWLEAEFEPRHGIQDIPSGAPELVRARKNPRNVHETTVHELCSLIIVPATQPTTASEAGASTSPGLAADPGWRAEAKAALATIRRHVDPLVQGDPDTCSLLRRLSSHAEGTSRWKVRFEASGLDIHACAEMADDGSCRTPRWAAEWVEHVEKAKGPGFLPPFFSRFGLHYVYVHDILPPSPADDPATEQTLRTAVLTEWRARRLAEQLQAMRTQDTVRVRSFQDAAPAP